jgi:hypothetical protein
MKERCNLQNKTVSKQSHDKPKSWLETIPPGREMYLIQALVTLVIAEAVIIDDLKRIENMD